MGQLQKSALIVLTCFAFVVAICYLITSTSTHSPVRKTKRPSAAQTEVSVPLPLMSYIMSLHAKDRPYLRSFKETFIAFPWNEFEAVAAKNLEQERLQFMRLFIDELTYYAELEPFVPINQSCEPPPLLAEVNCTLYPNAFNGNKRNESVKIGALMQFGFDVDVLEIHLNELYGIVDVFFIIESTHAHYGGVKKPLVWEHIQRQDRFLKFPVVHFIVDDTEFYQAKGDKMWSMEVTQERLRWKKFLEWNDKTNYFGDDDVIGFGDADEIPSRTKLNMFKYCELRGDAVDFGIWFPFGLIDQAFKTDFPVKGHPFTLGDPTYYTLASAKALAVKKPNDYPNRKRGRSGNYILGGIHMTHYGYLPYQLIKYATATESHMETLQDVQKISKYLKIGNVTAMEVDFAATPKHFARRIIKVDRSNSEMNEICVLPWFYDCNRDRYPMWEGGHDTRLDVTS